MREQIRPESLRMKHLAACLVALLYLLAAGCLMSAEDNFESAPPGGDGSAGGDVGSESPGEATGDGAEVGSGSEIEPGTLTAGVWDDNLNFDYYLDYLAELDDEQLAGRAVMPRADRLIVNVTEPSGRTLPGARVTLLQGGAELDATTTGADGRALFFPQAAGAIEGALLTFVADLDGLSAETSVAGGSEEVDIVVHTASLHQVDSLDLALIIDTTGSMGDEIEYLSVEIDAIAEAVAAEFPNVQQRYGLVLYRDEGDDYLTRVFDFTTDLQEFQANLSLQVASGGGDYPEALDAGLEAGVDLSWREGKVARVAFLIADAPHHVGNEDRILDGIAGARDKAIRFYPVAASGADKLVEDTMRTLAQVTGGRFIFLTDDSGVGDSHLEPTIPCYHVTRFDQAMVRMIAIEVTGNYIPVDPDDVIRTGGDPQDGLCSLEDGSQLLVF